MKNKALLLTFLMVALAAGGYYSYTYLVQTRSVGYWEMVPSSAIAVYQRSDCEKCVDSSRNSAWIKLLKEKVEWDAAGDTAILSRQLAMAKKAELISIHRTTKNDFDFIFYTSLEVIPSEWRAAENTKSAKKKERVFNGLTIHERTFEKHTIAWVQRDKYAAWSSSALLIEDVIRAINREGKDLFKEKLGEVAALPTVKNDAGDLFLDLQEVRNWLSGFMSDVQMPQIGKASLLDIKRSNNALVLNGFSTVDSADQQSFLSMFEGQAPVPFGLKRFVSNEAQFVIDFGFSDANLLGDRLQRGISELERNLLLKALAINKDELMDLYKGLGQEFAFVSMETGTGSTAAVLLVDVKGSGKWMETLDKVAKNTSVDTVFIEQYSSYSIKRIPVGGVIELVFPVLRQKTSELYYVQVGNVIMMAENLRAVKMILQDFELENTWPKSMEKNRFLESTLLESNVSFYVDPSRSQKMITDGLHPEWKRFYLNNQELISKFGISAIQFSFLNSNFYTNLYLTFANASDSKPALSSKEVLVSLPTDITSKIFIVKNHYNKSNEVLIQDSAHQIYLISAKGEVLWKKQLDGNIKGRVSQIDYFANGKLQVLMLTEKSLHVIDRLGNYVKPFPVSAGSPHELVRVIDYDHSRKYRYLLADKQGVVRMTNKEGVLLEGWEGLKSGGELLVAPKHFRIAAKDYIAHVQKSGTFHLYTRRGERLKDFPVDLKTRPLGDFFYQEVSKTGQPGFVFIGAEGYRIKVDEKGREISRETLIKSSIETQFKLVIEDAEKGYVIAKQDNKSIALLSDKLEPIFTNDFIGLSRVDINYFDFGSGRVYYVLLDIEQNLAYVYGSKGALLTTQPIVCDHLTVMQSEGKFWLVAIQDNQLRLTTLE